MATYDAYSDSNVLPTDNQVEIQMRDGQDGRRKCWHQNDQNDQYDGNGSNDHSVYTRPDTTHRTQSSDVPPPLPKIPPPFHLSDTPAPSHLWRTSPTSDLAPTPAPQSPLSQPSSRNRVFYDDEVGYECPDLLNIVSDKVVPLVRLKDWKFNNDRSRYLYREPRFEIDLLLIGKTGQGKSALGNSILARNAFVSKPAATSVTKSVTDELVEYKGYVIKVVDGPGVQDTDEDEDAQNMIIDSLSGAITINLRGYHAFLLVVKFGERFTKESKMTIEVLKKVFGPNFVKDYCILVMTYGDQLDDDTSFKDWLSEQKGDMMELVKECNNRVILFDNKTKEKEKKYEQLDALLDMVHMLVLENGRYTDEQFNMARLSRDAMMLGHRKSLIEEESMKEASLILEKFQSWQADKDSFNDPNSSVLLDELSFRTNTLLENLKQQDKNTGVLMAMIKHAESLQNSIKDEIRLVKRIARLMEDLPPKGQKMLQDQICRQKNKFYLSHVEGKKQEQQTDGQSAISSDPELSAEKLPEIENLKEQWEKSKELGAELKDMKNKKKNTILKTFQDKVFKVLNKKMKEGRKSVDQTNVPEPE